ncbi:pericentrin [Protopterus annectens]|uniref:pericentrin n=1 Tax=Protopterus annectens TaxID=7888 RepID=UPI001CFA4722|nr:pericentrin [Protopterus annectens]
MDERQRKLDAGRAMFANFRQRKAKCISTTQKKVPKRKGAPVNSHNVPVEECTLTSQVGHTAEVKDVNASVKNSEAFYLGDGAGNEIMYDSRDITENDEESSSQSDVPAHLIAVLENTISHRDEIITQLTSNLQQVMKNRDETQEETVKLTEQVHMLQHQLQETNELLKTKSPQRMEYFQGQQQVESFHKHTREQSRQMEVLQHQLLTLQQEAIAKEKLFNQMAEKLKKTEDEVQQLMLTIREKEASVSELHQALLLRTKELELLNEIHTNEVEILQQKHEEDVSIRLLEQRTEMENSYQCEIAKLQQQANEYTTRKVDEMQVQKADKYAFDDCPENSERSSGECCRKLEAVIASLNTQLNEKDNARQELAIELEDAAKEFEVLQQQFVVAKEQARSALEYKQENELLHKEMQRQNFVIQDLSSQVPVHTETFVKLHAKNKVDSTTFNEQPLEFEKENMMNSSANLQVSEHDLIERDIVICQDELKLFEQQLLQSKHTVQNDFKCEVQAMKEKLNEIKAIKKFDEDVWSSEASHAELLPFVEDTLMDKYLMSTELEETGMGDELDSEFAVQSHFELNSEILLDHTMDSTPPDIEHIQESLCSYRDETEQEAEYLHLSVAVSQNEQNILTEEFPLVLSDGERNCRESRHCEKIPSQALEDEALVMCKFNLVEKHSECKMASKDEGEFVKNLGDTSLLRGMLHELQEEKDQLLRQLRAQEQLVKDVQEQKLASDSVTGEVQFLFGRQLATLQSQRDQLQAQLDSQKEKIQSISELLGQKTVSEDKLLEEQRRLNLEMQHGKDFLRQVLEEKSDLETRLSSQQNELMLTKEALENSRKDGDKLRKNIDDLNLTIINNGQCYDCERSELHNQIRSCTLELEKLVRQLQEKEDSFCKNEAALLAEIDNLNKGQRELKTQYQQEVERLEKVMQETREEISSFYEKQIHNIKSQHQSEVADLRIQHGNELQDLHAEMDEKVKRLQGKLMEEHREQIGFVKQVHEREHEREVIELMEKHQNDIKQLRDELTQEQQELFDNLREQINSAHQAEFQKWQLQVQTEHHLELEALRLSLANIHTAQLELSQSNMQKEKEAALTELRQMMNDYRAQEVAVLQSRQKFELDRLKEQHKQELELMMQHHAQQMDDARRNWEQDMEEMKTSIAKEHARALEIVTEESDKKVQDVLSKHQTEMAEMKTEQDKLVEELNSLHSKLELAEKAYTDLKNDQTFSLDELRQELQAEHQKHLEEMKHDNEKKDLQYQQEVAKLQALNKEQKMRSEQEVQHLWLQLENSRTSRQDLSELKEQLLARNSHVEELERLKQDFAQQQKQMQVGHEKELEHLRTYFEQKLRESEETYREEICVIQQRLQEGLKQNSLMENEASGLSSSGIFFDDLHDHGKSDLLEDLNQQLEHHKEELNCLRMKLEEKHQREMDTLRSILELEHKEKLLELKMALSDRHFSELQEMKNRHSLELEQLRARLSDAHIKDITRLRLHSAQDAARQVEAETAERLRILEEEYSAKLSLMESEKERIMELEGQIEQLKTEHAEELYRITGQHQEQMLCEINKVNSQLLEEFNQKLNRAKEESSQLTANECFKTKEAELAALRKELQNCMEGQLLLQREELLERTRQEKMSLKEEFALREAGLNHFHKEQAAQILQLEMELNVERKQLKQLEESLESEQNPQLVVLHKKIQAQYDEKLASAKAFMAEEMKKFSKCQQEESAASVLEAQNRLMEEHADSVERFAEEKSSLLQQLKERHDELESQIQQLKSQHQQQLDAVKAEHQANTELLRAELEAQNQERFKALEVELQSKHLAQVEELEAKHLSNLDNLESSYLSEIQSIRDEHELAVQDLKAEHLKQMHTKQEELAEVHQNTLEDLKKESNANWVQEMEKLNVKHKNDLRILEDRLRKELSSFHLEKFKAMSYELEEAHKVQLEAALQNQKSLLEAESCRSLDALRQEVLAMEKQHQKALQELQAIHLTEMERQKTELSQHLQEELNKLQEHHQKEQELYASASECEIVAMRKELLAQYEEEKHQQQLRFQEEIELLKCQSEVLLEHQINQLKDEFETEKKAVVDEQKTVLNRCQEEAEEQHHMEKEQLESELNKKTELIAQLQDEVTSLHSGIDAKNTELETLLQRRERENQEGGNLVTMLKSDLEHARNERKSIEEANDRLQKLFLEVMRAMISTEDAISRRIGICLDHSLGTAVSEEQSKMGVQLMMTKQQLQDDMEEQALLNSDAELTPESSLASALTDEGCELSQRLCDSIFSGYDLDPASEELILSSCQRLRLAIEKLLELVTESTKQLDQSHGMNTELQEQFLSRNQEMTGLVIQHQDLLEHLSKESEAKSHLALELHKAEGVIEGYVAEKAALEEALRQKESSEHSLVLQLENLQKKFQLLCQDHARLTGEQDLLVRQKEALATNLDEAETGGPAASSVQQYPGLLKEVEQLAQEKLELQCQGEKDRSSLLSQLKVLEVELEEHVSKNQQLENEWRTESTDLKQQIQAMEKQLRNQRQFIEEQSADREHERDEFQQEIQKLEAQLKQPTRFQGISHHISHKVEGLQATIKEKTNEYNELLMAKEQLERDAAEQTEEIEKMTMRIKELENVILNNADSATEIAEMEQEIQKMKKREKELEQDKDALQQQQLGYLMQISALQSKLDESRHRVPDDVSGGSELRGLLQEEREALLQKTKEDKDALQQQQLGYLMQISALQSKLDESRHRVPDDVSGGSELRGLLQEEREALLQKTKEIETLMAQLEQFQDDLICKDKEVLHLNMQLEIHVKETAARTNQLQEENRSLKENVENLRTHLGMSPDGSGVPLLQFPQALLQEKNLEIDHLNEQIVRLQQELESSTASKLLESKLAEIEELKTLIEHLRGDQERLRRDKEVEAEQLHEVIEKLQQELDQLAPNRHELSDSQESLSPLRLDQVENLQNELRQSSVDLPEEEDDLKKGSVAILDKLQDELTVISKERDILQQQLKEGESHLEEVAAHLTLSLQEVQASAREQLSELNSLQFQHQSLQEDYSLLKMQLSKRNAEIMSISEDMQELEHALRAKENQLLEGELLYKTLQQEMKSELAKFEHLPKRINELESELSNKDLQLQSQADKISILCSEKDELSSQLQDLKQKEVGYITDIEKLESEVTRLNLKLEEHLKEQEKLHAERVSLTLDLEALKQKESVCAVNMEGLELQVKEKDSEIQKLKTDLLRLEEQKALASSEDLLDEALQEERLSCVRGQLSGAESLLTQTRTTLHEKEELLFHLTSQHEQLRTELVAVKEELTSNEDKIEKLLEQGQEKDRTISDLKIHNRNLKTQVCQLQDVFLKQGIELTRAGVDQNEQRSQLKGDICHSKHSQMDTSPCHSPHRLSCFSPTEDMALNIASEILEQSSLGSPELERKYDGSNGYESTFHVTQFSDISAIQSSGLEMGHTQSFILQKDTTTIDSDQRSKDEQDLLLPLPCENDVEKGEEFHKLHANLPDSQENVESSLPVPDWAGDEYDHSSDFGVKMNLELEKTERLNASFLEYLCQRGITLYDDVGNTGQPRSTTEVLSPELQVYHSSDFGVKMNLELEKTERLNASFLEYLCQRGITLYDDVGNTGQPRNTTEVLSPELQVLLKKVHEEGCKILALSERPVSSPLTTTHSQPNVDLQSWQQERNALLEVIQSLKELIANTSKQTEKSASDAGIDWRGEMILAVRSVFEKEENSLRTGLLSQLHGLETGDNMSLVERIEKIIVKQEEKQHLVIQELLAVDRSSLLAEVQDLQSQLRISHLQNQEKLQQLQDTLISVEDHGRKFENQLRKQVELLEYKLQQEQLIATDLQKSLKDEQQRSGELREYLKKEESIGDELKHALSENKDELERLLKAHQQFQEEIHRLSSFLKKKESDLDKAVQSLAKEQKSREELQSLLEQEQLRNRRRDDLEELYLQDLKASLEDHQSQCKQLLSALEHEQALNSNLRKELQIEQSRCEALLSQERSKLLQTQDRLEVEKEHSLELNTALNRERTLNEQLSQRLNDETSHTGKECSEEENLLKELQTQLREERSKAAELAAMFEKTQQQAILSKRELESEAQLYREEVQKEREVGGKLRATLESMQNQNHEVVHTLEMEKQHRAKLQTEHDQLQAHLLTLKEQEKSREDQRERKMQQERRAVAEKERDHERDKAKIQELELQHQRDNQRIKELQHTLAELEEQERALTSQKRFRTLSPSPEKRPFSSRTVSPQSKTMQQWQQQLENARQHLLMVATHLTEFMQKTSGRLSFSEDDTFSVIQSLTELKSELQQLSFVSQARSYSVESIQEAEREVWQKEKIMLQNAVKQAEAKLARVTTEIAEIENRPQSDTSNPKMLKLYRRYLRAESFRKALVYQKKYLLLLLGGFQECEKATLSLIARMGVYPSPSDLPRSSHRPRAFTRFRCAVRVVIAISRIKFLVKKWQKVTKKGVPFEGIANGVHVSASGIRTEVLRQQQSPSVILNSPPTRDTGARQQTGCTALTHPISKSPYRLHNRSYPSSSTKSSHERSYSSSRDPECSLTEYIHHLEAIQQRLGGLQEESSFGKSPYWNKTK